MADHHHHSGTHTPGTMDISDHERVFAGFVRMTMRAVALIIAVLVFLALANA